MHLCHRELSLTHISCGRLCCEGDWGLVCVAEDSRGETSLKIEVTCDEVDDSGMSQIRITELSPQTEFIYDVEAHHADASVPATRRYTRINYTAIHRCIAVKLVSEEQSPSENRRTCF